MKYYKIYCLSISLLVSIFSVQGQTNKLLNSLEDILFPYNELSEERVVLKEFTWDGEEYTIKGRKNQPGVKDMKVIEDLLKDIRTSENTSLINGLSTIQKKHEQLFLIEWEPAWRIGHSLYDHQYEILMNIEMTLVSLYMNSFATSKEKYKYMKNIYMLQWGDRDGNRKKEIDFFSDYIKNKWNGACVSTKFCSPALLMEKAETLREGILEDLSSFVPESLIQAEKHYYLITLGKALINIKSDEVEDVYINRINELDELLPNDEFGRNSWIFTILGKRGRKEGISFLLNELNNEDLLVIPKHKLQKLAVTRTGRSLLEERFLRILKTTDDSNLQEKYLKILLSLVYQKNIDATHIDNLKTILSHDNKVILQNFIDSKFK